MASTEKIMWINAVIDKDTGAKFKKLAAINDETVSQIMRKTVKKYIKEYESKLSNFKKTTSI